MDVKLTPLMLKLLFAALLCSSTVGFGDDLKFSLLKNLSMDEMMQKYPLEISRIV